MKMELTVSSETSAIRTQTPGNYPKRNTLYLEHGESLKTGSLIKPLSAALLKFAVVTVRTVFFRRTM